jgi:hypothetical protein
MVRKITVAKMGATGTEVEITGKPTYKQIVAAAGFDKFKAIMSDALGYVEPNDKVDDTTQMLILSAPKFDAGFGAIPSVTVEDDDGNEYTLTPVENTAAVAVEEPSTRDITVSKMGATGVNVTIAIGVTTYRQAVSQAGFTAFKAIMADSIGYVEADEVVDDSVNMLILSAPKFDAGFGAIPSVTVEDDDGNEYTLTPVENAATAVAVEELSTRDITVSKMGATGVNVTITVGVTTYRQAVARAGFTAFKAIMADSIGYVEVDEVVDDSVNMLILSAPKFDAGN